MWEVRSGDRASPYNITPGYDPSERRIPLATAAPPLARQRIPAASPAAPIAPAKIPTARAARTASPYGVSADYDPSTKRIPLASAPPSRMAPTRAPIPPRAPPSRGGPIPPSRPPPRRLHQTPTVSIAPKPAPAWQPPQQESRLDDEAPLPPIRLSLPRHTSFVEDGYSNDGCAVYADSRLPTSSVSYILAEFLEDPASEIAITHDTEWDQFPEVGEALLQAGGEEKTISIAFCPSLGAWGVGCGGSWKKREAVAKLALCASLLENHENASFVLEQFPDFAEYCGAGRPPARGRKKRPAFQPEKHERYAKTPKVTKVAKQEPVDDSGESEGFPKDVPVWIKLPSDELMPDQLDGLLPEALAVGSDGKKRGGLYSCADKVISELFPSADIEYIDDSDWSLFPSVGAALKEVCQKEECMTIALCPSHSIWAVGVGGKGKARWAAAKVAMAASLMWQEFTINDGSVETEHQAMLDFVNEVRQAREDVGW